LPEILNRSSKLPVLYAHHNVEILPSRVYVAPAGQRHMVLERGRVRLEPGPRENRSRQAIDALFRSASYAYGSNVVGVVLTGNLDDGTAGLVAIKNRGGLAIVQNPDEAVSPSMPASAIEATEVDFILPGEQIGPKLVALASTEGAQDIRVIPGRAADMAATGQTYACPECGGVLEETKEGSMLRFRCRVGHIYSPDSLMADQTESVERALWAAIRSMEEQAQFSDRLADSSRHKERLRLAERFAEKADANRENASILRDLLAKTSGEVLEMRLEDGGSEQLEDRGSDFEEQTGTN